MSLKGIYYLHEIGEKKTQEDYIWPVAGAAGLQSSVFVVCDGVGGSENGEVASRVIAETVGNLLTSGTDNVISPEYIQQVLQQAKKELVLYANSHGLNSNMATTFSLLLLLPGKALISWCGDSRVYHIRNGDILFKTEDHSLVNNLIKTGELSEEEGKNYPGSNIILKAIKADDLPADADFHWIDQVIANDYFFLCTDGLLENISDDDLRFLMRPENGENNDILASIQQKCKDNTRDNYSMYLLQIAADPITTNPVPIRKRNRHRILWIVLAFVLLISVAFLMKANTGEASSATNEDSVSNKTNSGKSSAEDTKIKVKLNADTLPVFEIISSSDSTSDKQPDSSLPQVKPSVNASNSPIPKNLPGEKKKTKKGGRISSPKKNK